MSVPIPIVVYGQWWQAVGSGENEMTNWCAAESERRWNNCSTVMGVLGNKDRVQMII